MVVGLVLVLGPVLAAQAGRRRRPTQRRRPRRRRDQRPPVTLRLAVPTAARLTRSSSGPAGRDAFQRQDHDHPDGGCGRDRGRAGGGRVVEARRQRARPDGDPVLDVSRTATYQALRAPFLVGDDALATPVAEGDVGRRALDGMEGIISLAWWPLDCAVA